MRLKCRFYSNAMANLVGYISLICFVIISASSLAQTIPAERKFDWHHAGFRVEVAQPTTTLDITSYGGVGNGTGDNFAALQSAITALGGQYGTIYFPAGTYRFTSPVFVPDSVVIKGAGATQTTLRFSLPSVAPPYQNLINVNGDTLTVRTFLSTTATRGEEFIKVTQSNLFAAGDHIRLMHNDSSLVISDWAYKSVGQIFEITGINANTLFLNSPLRRTYDLSYRPRIQKLKPRTHVGIECLKLEREDQTPLQTSNIDIHFARYCWVLGVESDTTNFAHVAISRSTNIVVRGCYMHHAFDYGGGGNAYGVALQYSSNECLVDNNIFSNLRHGVLLQAGANGNVVSYNYFANPQYSGDIAVHGNYAYANLMEGNSMASLNIDDSHDRNGPYNMVFRNRHYLYGLAMSSVPASDSQSIVGNEITFGAGLYTLTGSHLYAYGNNVRGTLMPSGTNNLQELSLYLNGRPEFFGPSDPWPAIGDPSAYNTHLFPAQNRFSSSTKTLCDFPSLASVRKADAQAKFELFPNPVRKNEILYLGATQITPDRVSLIGADGKLHLQVSYPSDGKLKMPPLPAGLYRLMLHEEDKVHSLNLVILD